MFLIRSMFFSVWLSLMLIVLLLCGWCVAWIVFGDAAVSDYLQTQLAQLPAHIRLMSIALSNEWLPPSMDSLGWLIDWVHHRLSQWLAHSVLFILGIIIATSEGFLAWQKRGYSGARERAWVFHQAKRGLFWPVVLSVCLALLVPIAISIEWIILPCVVLFSIKMYACVRFYKKVI